VIFDRLVGVATLVSVGFALTIYWLESDDRQLQREANVRAVELAELSLEDAARQEELLIYANIQNAWERLSERVPGNGGKGEALELLIAENVPLMYLDLSCETMAGAAAWDEKENECSSSVFLGDIDFSGVNLAYADFRGANLEWANFDNAILVGVDFRGATIQGSTFRGAHVSKARFEGAPPVATEEMMANIWAYENQLPTGSRSVTRNLTVCEFRLNLSSRSYPHPLYRPRSC
jgi:uncharacterized protein YjbI with pentapeptide repeats